MLDFSTSLKIDEVTLDFRIKFFCLYFYLGFFFSLKDALSELSWNDPEIALPDTVFDIFESDYKAMDKNLGESSRKWSKNSLLDELDALDRTLFSKGFFNFNLAYFFPVL